MKGPFHGRVEHREVVDPSCGLDAYEQMKGF